MKSNAEQLSDLMEFLNSQTHVTPEEIPNIDLYMDQVTTFMEEHLKDSKRYEEDKVLTKTMINNYAKNNLLPPPVKKKYSRDHMLMLIFIYYYKGILSISDIQTVLKPVTDSFFGKEDGFKLEDVYNEVFSLEKEEVDFLKKDVIRKYDKAQETFQDAPEKDREFLRTFSFICMLSFDVYVKKLLIEKLIDTCAPAPEANDRHSKHPKA